MANWLPLPLVFGVVLVTSYTSMGLLALWAATSRWHWLLRSAVVLAVLAPLLLIPAYEPWIVFALQTGTVAVGVQLWRWRAARRHVRESPSENCDTPKRRFRFSLATLLALVPLVAVLTAIGTRIVADLPEQNTEAWTTIVLNGLCSGCAVLLGAWMVAGKRKPVVWLTALLLCLGLAAILAWFEWFVWSLRTYQIWPPDPQAVSWMPGVVYKPEPRWVWFAIMPIFMVGTWLMVYVCGATTSIPAVSVESGRNVRQARNMQRNVVRCAFGLLLLVLALPPALVVWELLHPQPLPEITVPCPNALDDILAAGEAFSSSPILRQQAGPIATDELAAEINRYAEAYDRLRLGLSREVRSNIWAQAVEGTRGIDNSTANLRDVRSAVCALMREAELAQREGRCDDAARIGIETIRFGQAIARDGTLIHYLAGIMYESMGDQCVYQALPQLDAEQCCEVIATLFEVEQQREPLDEVMHRDRVWAEHGRGWYGHFCFLLDNPTASQDQRRKRTALQNRTSTETRLLMAELALHVYQLQRGTLPERLEQLVPRFLPDLPVDPFDPERHSLRYIRRDDEYVLYSVGPDGKDDGGTRPFDPKWARGFNPDGNGDLQLAMFFPPDNQPGEDAVAAEDDGQHSLLTESEESPSEEPNPKDAVNEYPLTAPQHTPIKPPSTSPGTETYPP